MASRMSINIYILKYVMAVRKLLKYFRSWLIKDTPLLTCLNIGELRNGRKFKCENKHFSSIFILILRKGSVLDLDFLKFNSNIEPLGRIRLNPKLKHRVRLVVEF